MTHDTRKMMQIMEFNLLLFKSGYFNDLEWILKNWVEIKNPVKFCKLLSLVKLFYYSYFDPLYFEKSTWNNPIGHLNEIVN